MGAKYRIWLLLAWMSSLTGLAFAGSSWNDPPAHYREALQSRLGNHKIIVPTLVNQHGEFISYDIINSRKRTRRNVSSAKNSIIQRNIHYKLPIILENESTADIHLNLSLNFNLVTRNFSVEYRNASGVSHRHNVMDSCHYRGHIVGHHRSRVALSNCKGLHGLIRTNVTEYFVEPLHDYPGHIAEGHPHVIYKRSTFPRQHKEASCGVSEDDEAIKQSWWMQHSDFSIAQQVHKQRKKRSAKRPSDVSSISSERNVETMVVADKQMVGYHGENAVEGYLLMLMNIVADLYHDASIGNAINILISRLILLLDDQSNLRLNNHADKSLQSFCAWQQAIRPAVNSTDEMDRGISNHDNAVLITRYDICMSRNEPCGTIGLAPVGVMCKTDQSCNINEDTGLSTAFTIAHEIGHNFGMRHDGDGNVCADHGGIMVNQITENYDPFSWSTCSQDYVTAYIESGRAGCLDNEPSTVTYQDYPTVMPGELVGGDKQCELQYGPGNKACKTNSICRELTCQKPGSHTCWRTNTPAAEGTRCQTLTVPDGWCYQAECVQYGNRAQAINGGWGMWSSWNSCSRTCGGGVSTSERHCDTPRPAHRGQYCTGERSRYRSCNTDDCVANAPDFRSVQCSRYDNAPYGNYGLYTWKPFNGQSSSPCELSCITNTSDHLRVVPELDDGTRCFPERLRPDVLDICIKGKCHHVGCDKRLGSDAREDKCRICGGIGTTCETVQGTFQEHPIMRDYQEILTIPSGSVHIVIEEMSISKNFLALKSVNNDYYINARWVIEWPKAYEVAGTTFKYERPDNGPERLMALGPVNEELVVMLLVQEVGQLGVRYTFNRPVTRTGSGDEEVSFVWHRTDWSDCSATCAGGESTADVLCTRYDDQTEVSELYCNADIRPNRRTKVCNPEPCPPEWSVGQWSECTRTCGGGHATRMVLCKTRVTQLEEEVVDETNCLNHKPPERKLCGATDCPPQWVTDNWSQCVPMCGSGHKTRRVKCMSSDAGIPYLPNMCDRNMRPQSTMVCNSGACPPPNWITGPWSECNARCGRGQKRRTVYCQGHTGMNLAPDHCSASIQPSRSQECESPCGPTETDEACEDAHSVQYCPLVKKFRFCSNDYFRKMCCKTCSRAR